MKLLLSREIRMLSLLSTLYSCSTYIIMVGSCHREYHPGRRKRQQMDSGNKWGVKYHSETIFGEKKRRSQSITAA